MLLSTNAHRMYYLADGALRINDSKFKNIIAKLINYSPYKMGSGLPLYMLYNNNKIDYMYWDNPNELVDRLRLLIASQATGNTSLANEINAIVEELREANIIY